VASSAGSTSPAHAPMGAVLPRGRSDYTTSLAPEDFAHPALSFDRGWGSRKRSPRIEAGYVQERIFPPDDEPVRVVAAAADRSKVAPSGVQASAPQPGAGEPVLPGQLSTIGGTFAAGTLQIGRQQFGGASGSTSVPGAALRTWPAGREKAEQAALASVRAAPPSMLRAGPTPGAASSKIGSANNRETEQQAAIAAVRAALPQNGRGASRLSGRSAATATPGVSGRGGPGKSVAAFGHVDVDMVSRRALLRWVQRARRSLHTRSRRPRRGGRSRRARQAARVHRVIELFLENEEELDRLCYEDPARIISVQIELLTRRIDALSSNKGGHAAAATAGSVAIGTARTAPVGGAAASLGGATPGPKGTRAADEEEGNAEGNGYVFVPESWETVFDRAMQGRRDWKKGRAEATNAARATGPLQVPRQTKNPGAVAAKDDPAAQLRAERARLAAILPRYERQQRRQRQQEEQSTVDLVEALRSEQRAAMDARGEQMREERRKHEAEEAAAAERKRLAAEAEQRRLDALAKEAERRRLEAERRRREAEEEAERRRRQAEAEAAAAKRRRAEEEAAERIRRQAEEAAATQRRKRQAEEAAEAERRRRREAEEADQRRRREAEEAEQRRRREAEAEEARRRAAEAEEAQRQALEALKRAEEARQRAEKAQEEQRRVEEQRRKEAARSAAEEAPKRSDRRLAAFDALEGGDPPGPATAAAPPPAAVARKRSAGPDFLARAMAALGDDDESSSGGSGGEEEDGGAGAGAGAGAAADAELIKLSGAIMKRIDALHAA